MQIQDFKLDHYHMIEKIKNWWRGKYIPPPKNDPDSQIVFISPGRYERPFLAKVYEFIKYNLPNEKGWFIKLLVGGAVAFAIVSKSL